MALRAADVAARIPSIPAADPARGWIVAVPNWHAFVLAPAGADDADQAWAGELRPVVARLFDYVDSVSPDLFRVRGEAWTRMS
ncbi:MAG: hypothetical protein U1F43_02350 [Myxococcota bacterium]